MLFSLELFPDQPYLPSTGMIEVDCLEYVGVLFVSLFALFLLRDRVSLHSLG